jgi:hypothetical protein
MIRTLIVDKSGRVLLKQDGNSWTAFSGEQQNGESEENAVLRIISENAGVELPFFTKLLEQDSSSWYLVALDSWPPLRADLALHDMEGALHGNLEWNTRYVLEWFSNPSEAYVQSPSQQAAEA